MDDRLPDSLPRPGPGSPGGGDPPPRPAFRGDAAFRDDRFDDPHLRATHGPSLADEIAPDTDDRPLADPLARLGARLLDGVACFAAMLPGVVALVVLGGISAETPFGSGGVGLGLMALGLAAVVLYNAWLAATTGQTVGKRALRLRIVDADDGSNPGGWRAVGIRGIANWLISAFVPLYSLVDALLIFREDRKCIHDHLAKTVVVTEAGRS